VRQQQARQSHACHPHWHRSPELLVHVQVRQRAPREPGLDNRRLYMKSPVRRSVDGARRRA
jgi:hypothetical protein